MSSSRRLQALKHPERKTAGRSALSPSPGAIAQCSISEHFWPQSQLWLQILLFYKRKAEKVCVLLLCVRGGAGTGQRKIRYCRFKCKFMMSFCVVSPLIYYAFAIFQKNGCVFRCCVSFKGTLSLQQSGKGGF